MINNLTGAVFDIRSDVHFMAAGTASVFNNAGTLRKSAGTGESQFFYLTVNNSGAVEVQSGKLSLHGGGDSTGTFTAESGATLEFAYGTYLLTSSSRISGGGEVRFGNPVYVSSAYVMGTYAVTGSTVVAGGTGGSSSVVHFFTTTPVTSGPLTISAGSAAFYSDVTVPTLTLSGGSLTGIGTVTVTGLTTWTGGIMGGGGRTIAQGGLRIEGPNRKYFDDRTIDNEADAVWSGGDIAVFTIYRGGVIHNAVGVTFDIQVAGDFYFASTESLFNNRGTLRKSVGAGTANFHAALNNTGAVEVLAGTLRVGYPVGLSSASTGSFTVQPDAGFAFFGPHHLASTATFSGTGRLQIDAPVTYAGDFNLGSLALAVATYGVLTVTGTFTQTGGSTALAFAGTLSVAGGVNLQAGTLSGAGRIIGNVTNAASVSAGDATTTGTLTITGNYTQTTTGRLTAKIASAFLFDVLAVSGAATLAGTLDVTLLGGYSPPTGTLFRVLTAGSLNGAFGTLAGDGSLFDPLYDSTGLTLRRR